MREISLEPLRLYPLASSSSGNAIYIGTDKSKILIDVGISTKKVQQGLENIGVNVKEISAICITHEHSDHIKGLGVFLRKYPVPVYATEETIAAIRSQKSLGALPDVFQVVYPDREFSIEQFNLLPLKISHDAANPVAYRIDGGEGRQAAVLTDLGEYNTYLEENLKGLHTLLLEANHDLRMLEVGPYPYVIKRRIASEYGHLSNKAAGEFLAKILHQGLRDIYLGHLSKENNYAALAYETVCQELRESIAGEYLESLRLQVVQ
ncbi:MBL fold metallo-hydrolase [Clostridia bacterium]|nr:MBL fold metallo-hydrolase [Clostridia bacterium]